MEYARDRSTEAESRIPQEHGANERRNVKENTAPATVKLISTQKKESADDVIE